MDITVNGSPAATGPDPDSAGAREAAGGRGAADPTVAEFVRDGLGLTGTKLVCGTGVCGARTVLVDGTPTAGCLTPCGSVAGRAITTVEGIGGDGADGAHPVQRAFAAHDALQCGYCTPGFVVSAAAFTDRWRAEHGDVPPGRAGIAAALAGHLCRCGAYEGVYTAVAAACAGEFDTGDGEGPARVEAMEKVTGRAVFTTDIRLAGQLEGVIVRSRHAHARIGTVTPGDPAGTALVDLLGEDRTVRYAGQPVAAVAAPTRAEALAAAGAVRLEYAPLPAAVEAATAAQPGAPVVYVSKADRQDAPRSNEAPPLPAAWKGNVRGPASSSWRGGTAARRISQARERGGARLVTGVFTTAAQAHSAMEPHACVARWGERGDLHLHVSTQSVAKVTREAAERWRLPPSRVRVTAEHVGGGFGAKVGLGTEAVAAAELARRCGAPVRVVLSRAEEPADGGGRPATRTEIALLADAEGALAAMALDVHGDGGVSVGTNSAALARCIYGTAPRRLRDFDVVTHKPPGRPFRAPGGPPLAWALEQAVDEMAHRLGEDPVALRRRWDGNPKRARLYDWVSSLPAWTGRSPAGSARGRFRRGVGIAAANWLYLLDPATEVELSVGDGVVTARTATQDIGTGSRSVLAGIVRAELGLPADRVRAEVGRSGTVHGPASGRTASGPRSAAAERSTVRPRPPVPAPRRSRPPPATRPPGCVPPWASRGRTASCRPRTRPGT